MNKTEDDELDDAAMTEEELQGLTGAKVLHVVFTSFD